MISWVFLWVRGFRIKRSSGGVRILFPGQTLVKPSGEQTLEGTHLTHLVNGLVPEVNSVAGTLCIDGLAIRTGGTKSKCSQKPNDLYLIGF